MNPVFQSKVGECGLASLAMIASNYGYLSDLTTLRSKFSFDKNFMTLAELMESAEALCLKPRAVRVQLDQLKKLTLPCILHWDRNHFVVLRKVKRSLLGKVSLALIDPALGEIEISIADAAPHFSGIALELSPNEAFMPRDERIEPVALPKVINEEKALHAFRKKNFFFALISLISTCLVYALLSNFPSFMVDHGITNGTKLALLISLAGMSIVFLMRAKIASLKGNYELGLSRGLDYLLHGQFDKGWPLYEKRWQTSLGRMSKRNFTQPAWRGSESLHGKKILIYAEQGLGDTIQFCRYVSLVADLGAIVYFEVQETLEGLLQDLPGIKKIIKHGAPLPEFDYQCALLSLPGIFKTNLKSIPNQLSYLRPKKEDIECWERRLGSTSKTRIGLVWSGNASHSNDHNRSMPLAALKAMITAFPEVDFFSLQRDVSSADKNTLDEMAQISHFGHQLRNFADTAALCELMDYVISVDTSVAHLSAALGKTTFIMLPFEPDWRWLKGREDSPWYPSVSLYRQKSPGDWSNVIYQIKHDIKLQSIKK